MLNAHGLDVAGAVRVELDGGHAERSDALRVHLAGDIPFNDANAKCAAEAFYQRGDHACLAGPGAAHHVDHADMVLCKGAFYFLAYIFIPVHYLVKYFDLHLYLPPDF